MNFIYTIDPTAEEPIMLINKHIGYDEIDGMGIMGDQFQLELMTLDSMGKRRSEVWIVSEGGSVLEGEKIYSAILHAKMKVDTYCMGMTASIAAVIFEAGRTRYMADYGKLMYHEVSGAMPSELKIFNESIATMVSARTGTSLEKVLGMMSRTTWMNATESKDSGFCDEILPSGDANKGRLSKLSNIKDFNKQASLIMNKALSDKKQTNLNFNKRNMTRIANILNLNAEASDEAIALEISKLQNKVSDAENKGKASDEKMKELKEKADKATADYEDAKKELDKIKDAFGEKEKEAEEKDKEVKKEKAKNLVKIHTDRKAISNKLEIVEMWIEDATNDFEKAKIKLESIPVNNNEYVSVENKTEDAKSYVGVDKRKSYSNSAVAMAHVITENKLNY